MYESRLPLFLRIPIVLVVLILAAELMLLSLRLAAENGKAANADWAANISSNPHLIYNRAGAAAEQLGLAALETTAHIGADIGGGFLAIVRIPGNIVHFVAHATDVKAFIQPSSAVQVPIISPASDPTATKIAAAATVVRPVPVKPAAQPVVSKPAKRAASVKPATTATPRQISYANRYAWGNCTWWAAFRRAQVGDPIPGSWGNAATWANRAAGDGYDVNRKPSPGAIMQTPDSAGGLGHVAFVESVDSDGTWHISEMNVIGLDRVDHKAMPASAAANYSFIHDKV